MPTKLIPEQSSRLRQTFGIGDLVFFGLGSILGAGVFVGIGVVVGVAGSITLPAIVLAAIVALCTELNAAQLSIHQANDRTWNGESYGYGYQYLSPWLGFVANWAFLLAKVASAATAALGFAGYLLNALNRTEVTWLIPCALMLLVLITLILLCGLHHATLSRFLTISVTLLSLFFFLGSGLPLLSDQLSHRAWQALTYPFIAGIESTQSIAELLKASALMFVAYTGYGRIAYLNHAVQTPRRSIPRSIWISLMATLLLYLAVAIVGIGTIGSSALSNAVDAYIAPLALAIRQFGSPGSAQIVAIGAVTAMLGTLLNLMLDCSQLLQTMAQQQDIPRAFVRFNAAGTTPTLAVLAVSAAIIGFILIGNVETTWSFSAFSILLYAVIIHVAVLRLPAQGRFYARGFTKFSLFACLFLAFWVDWHVWIVSLGLIVIGLIWRGINQWTNEQNQ